LKIAVSISRVPIRLTDKQWHHISERHPELVGKFQEVLGAISSPTIVQQGDFDTLLAVKKENDKYLIVVYREISRIDGFIITAYYSKRLRWQRRVIWRP